MLVNNRKEDSVTLTRINLFKDATFYAEQQQVKLQSAQAKLLIAYCVETQDSLSRSALATLFWPERNESDGLKLLRNILNRITKKLPNLLEVDRYSIRLIVTDNSFDTHEVQTFSKSSSVEDWQHAVSLYSGRFLEDIPKKFIPEGLEEWLELRRQFYHHSYINNLHKLVHALSDMSATSNRDFEQAIFYVEAWQKEEPTNDRIYIHKLSILAQEHKYNELEQHYSQIKQLPLSKESQQAITNFYKSLDIPEPQDRLIHINKKTTVQGKEILGRESAILEITNLLQDHRIVTITGIGGIGKTHIVNSIAARSDTTFSDGIILISLVLTDASQLFNHLMRSLGIYRSSLHDPKEEIIKSLHEKNLLIVLDNAEHLTDTLGPFLSELISRTQHTRCIVSSRKKLSIASEQIYPLESLAVPEDDISLEVLAELPAAQLLVKQAEAHGQTLSFQETDKDTIIKLCQISHGLPLAIEIVAANLRHEPIETIAKQSLSLTQPVMYPKNDSATNLDTSRYLSSNLLSGTDMSAQSSDSISSISTANSIGEEVDPQLVEKLRSGGQDNTRRKTTRLRSKARSTKLQHNSLKACFEYSWSLLEEKHQMILAKQAIFYGGFSFDAFKEVTRGDAYDLAVLINTSLIRRSPSGRYERHPLIYQFCTEKLNDLAELKRDVEARHANYYVNYALELQEYLNNYQPDTAVKLEPEVNNFLRAIEYSIGVNDLKMIEPLVLTLTSYLGTQGRYHEAIALCKTVVQLNTDGNQNSIIEFFLYIWIVFFYSQAGEVSKAKYYLDRIETILVQLQSDPTTFTTLSEYQEDIPFFLGVYELVKGMHLDNQSLYLQAQPHFERAIELQKPFLKTHSNTTSILARNRLAFEYGYLGEFEKAKTLFEENLANGDYFLQPLDTVCLGDLLMHQKDPEAETVLLKGLELSQQKNMPLIQSIAHQYLGIFYVDKNEQQSIEHLNKALSMTREMAEHRIASFTLGAGFGQLYINTQQWLKAQEVLQEALELAVLCSAKLRMLSALLRLATIDLHLESIPQEHQTTALRCLDLVTEHPASHFIDRQKAKTLLSEHSSGEIEAYTLTSAQELAYENNRDSKLVESIFEILQLDDS